MRRCATISALVLAWIPLNARAGDDSGGTRATDMGAFGAKSALRASAQRLGRAEVGGTGGTSEHDLRLAPSSLRLDVDRAVEHEARSSVARQPEAGEPADSEQPPEQPGAPPPLAEERRYGHAGSDWVTIGIGYSHDLADDDAGEVHASYSQFLGDELEFAVELAGWYFDQTGDNAAGLNPTINFRWHFLHAVDYDWTFYGDVGIGVLLATDNVPAEGTGFAFTPRAGVGITKAIDDSGTRLQVGVRWQHISNGRIEGDERNPGRDSVMIYAGVIFPF